MFDDQAFYKNFLVRIPLGHLGKLEDLLGPIIYLFSPASDFMTGAILYADSGFIIPILFGIIEGGSGFTPAFIFGGVASILFAVIGFAAREPKLISAAAMEPIASLEEVFEPLQPRIVEVHNDRNA